MSEEFVAKLHSPYITLPKILRYLSFKNEDGSEKRIQIKHIAFLAYISETQEFYKTFQTMGRELGIDPKTVREIKEDLCLPTVELGVPLIFSSEFRDNKNQKRYTIEIFQHQEKMGQWYEKLYHKENGKSLRERWISQWCIEDSKDKKDKKEQSDTLGKNSLRGQGKIPQGVREKFPKGLGKNSLQINIRVNKPKVNIEDTNVSSCQEQAPARHKIEFNAETNKLENISEEFINDLKKIAPDININHAIPEMEIWLRNNSRRRKKNYDSFMCKWVIKSQKEIRQRNKKPSWEANSNHDDVIEKRKEKMMEEGSWVDPDKDEKPQSWDDALKKHKEENNE